MTIFSIIFYFQISFIFSSSEIKLTYDDFGRPYSSVCLGTKSLCLSLRLDTDYVDTLVHDSTSKKDIKNKYDSTISKKSSKIKENVDIKYNSKSLKADLIKDTIELDSLDIKKAFFYSIKEGDCEDLDKIDGILGLGYATKADQEKNSFMTQLYVNGYLDSKIWTIDLSDKSKGYIIPDKKVGGKDIGTDIELINNEEGHWFIKIKSILLGTDIKKDSNLEFGNDSQMKISTSEIKSSINLDILKKIGDGYFKKLIDSSECKFETKGKFSTYTCKNNNYDDIKAISLIFNDFGILIPKEKILVKDSKNNNYEFILANYDGEKNNVLGIDLLKGKKLVFNCEKMIFGLYGENMFDTTKTEEIKPKEEKEEESIIPKDKDDDDNEKEKDDDKKKDKDNDKKEEKEKEKDNNNNNQNQNNQNQNTNNNQEKTTNENVVVKSGSKKFRNTVIIILIIFSFICCIYYKRYRKRKAKIKYPFAYRSYNDLNVNGIQMVSDQ